jgi:hypothetical protein
MAALSLARHQAEGDRRHAAAVLTTGRGPLALRYTVEGAPVAAGSEPFLAASLLLAMRLAEPLAVPEPVSPRLLRGIERIQEIFRVWDRRFRPVPVDARPASGRPRWAGPRGVACFFSGGVDSFYTLLKHRAAVTALVFCEGWDPRLEDAPRRAHARAVVGAVAAELALPVVTVTTTIAEVTEPLVRWRLYHGAALASIALLLAPGFSRVLIPASHSYAELFPLGSHPLVDPLWSTEETALEHDGCEASRSERVARIAGHPIALRWLRVCWEGRDSAGNCGRCEKCLRTMIALRLAGALERCPAFERPLDLDAVARMDVSSVHARAYAEDNLRAAEADGRDPAVATALRACLARARAG